MKLLLGCLMGERDSLFPFPHCSRFVWDMWHRGSSGLSWSVQALPVPMCQFSLAGSASRLRRSVQSIQGTYVMVSVLFLTVKVSPQ